jgi:protocatechuate 3,4-dioxygenase beta subunit
MIMSIRPDSIRQVQAASSARRHFLRQLSLGAAFFTVPGAFAEELAHHTTTKTAWVGEGPFYPPKLPLDTDNDLIIVNDSITPAIGEITHLSGRLMDAKADPIRNATIELWEADTSGVYLADRRNRDKFDAHFQGFGRFLTGSTGEYYFRTIKPTPYSGRPAPHIHFKVKMKGQPDWTTQLFIKGDPGNAHDGVYRRIGDAKAQESVTKDFTPVRDSHIGELAVHFDIILGITPLGDHSG